MKTSVKRILALLVALLLALPSLTLAEDDLLLPDQEIGVAGQDGLELAGQDGLGLTCSSSTPPVRPGKKLSKRTDWRTTPRRPWRSAT